MTRVVATLAMVACWCVAPRLEASAIVITVINPLANSRPVQTYAISGDGQYVVGTQESTAANTLQYGFRANSSGASAGLGHLPPSGFSGDHTVGYGISGDGSMVVGRSNDAAFVWTSPGGIQALPTLPLAGTSWATGISSSGGTISGTVWMGTPTSPRAVRWDGGSAPALLDLPVGRAYSYAWATSGDGRVVVGDAEGVAVRWASDGSAQVLGTGVAYAANLDGSLCVGTSLIGGSYRAVSWDAAGTMSLLGSLGSQSRALGISEDGNVVVGSYGGFYDAFLWTPALGMVDLTTWLIAQGVDLTGWDLERATAVSRDGTAITGWGVYNGQYASWVVSGLNLSPVAVPGSSGIGVMLCCWDVFRLRRRRRQQSRAPTVA